MRWTGNLGTRHWLFLLLAVSTLVIAFTKLIPGLMPGSAMRTYYHPVRWWLLPHVVTGAIALLAGPLQFSNSLRRRRPNLHRRIGTLYLGAVAVSAPIAVVVTLLHVPLIPSLAPMVQGLAWVVATGMAWLMVRRRNYAQHREWMIRSYAITTTFVSTRILFSVPAVDRLNADGSAIIILSAVTCTLVAAEVGIQMEASGNRKRSS
jgi:uncharacterized membrane protein YozB (DUF420 family)